MSKSNNKTKVKSKKNMGKNKKIIIPGNIGHDSGLILILNNA